MYITRLYIIIIVSGSALYIQNLVVTPDNVECLASLISPGATIKETVIHFGPGIPGEIILRVPIATPDSGLVITMGIDSSHYNEHDATLHIGVTDRDKKAYFGIVDAKQYRLFPPCYPISATAIGQLVSAGTQVPSTFKFTINFKERFGYCETGQEGGYINVGKFFNELDFARPLYLQLVNWIGSNQHFVHYIAIESI